MSGKRSVLPLGLGLGVAAGAAYLYSKSRFQGQQYKGDERISGRTVIVTGANTGIGKAVATELAKRGGRVILACRDTAKGEVTRKQIVDASYNRNVVVKRLDLASMKSVASFANYVKENEERVDLLVNNAAVMMCPKTLTEDGFEQQLGVNHLGHFLLTNLLADKLRASAPSRVVNVTCASYSRGQVNFDDLNSSASYNPAAAYAQSKLANVLFTRELAARWQGRGVTVFAADPGTTSTELSRHRLGYRIVLGLLSPFTKSPTAAAQTVLHCAVNGQLSASSSGSCFRDCKEVTADEAPQSLSSTAAQRLWLVSARWTRLDDSGSATAPIAADSDCDPRQAAALQG